MVSPACISHRPAEVRPPLTHTCRYQVCLFCFERCKLDCKNQCPGCRREYGKVDPEDTCRDLSADEDDECQEVEVGGKNRQAQPPAASTSKPPVGATKAAAGGATQAGRRVEAATPGKRNNTAMLEEPAHGLPSGATWASQATTAAPKMSSVEGLERPPPPPAPAPAPAPAPVAMDVSAWPSLADASAQAAAIKAKAEHEQREQSLIQQQHHHQHRRSTSISISTTSIDGLEASYSSLDQMAQDAPLQLQQPEPLHSMQQQQGGSGGMAHQHQHQHQQHTSSFQQQALKPQAPPGFHQPIMPPLAASDAFSTAHVTTTVQGVRRSVVVAVAPTTPAPQDVNPEASAMLCSMRHAVRNGNVSSCDAAMQLLDMLRQKEGMPGRDPLPRSSSSLQMPGKAPPGFSPPPGLGLPPSGQLLGPGPVHLGAPLREASLMPLNNLDNPVIPGPPMSRCPPISPPAPGSLAPGGPKMNVGGGLSMGSLGLGPMSSANSGSNGHPGVYSMWSGLPGMPAGIDFSMNSSVCTFGAWQPSQEEQGGGVRAHGHGHGHEPAQHRSRSIIPGPGRQLQLPGHVFRGGGG